MAQPNIRRNSVTGEVAIYGNWDGENAWRIFPGDSDAAKEILHMIDAEQKAKAPKVTAAEELPSPFLRGIETATEELTKGLGEITSPQAAPTGLRSINPLVSMVDPALSIAGGGLRAVGAPAAGLGSAAGTAVHGYLSGLPLLGGPAGAVPAAGAALTDAAIQMLGGAGAIRGALNIGKAGVRAIGDLLTPAITREAGISALARYMGKDTDWVKRVMQAGRIEDELFREARAVQERVPLTGIVTEIRGVKRRMGGERGLTGEPILGEEILSTPNRIVSQRASNLLDKYSTKTETSYVDLIMETQDMKNKARGIMNREPMAAQELNTLAQDIIDKMDNVSPSIRAANNRYLKSLFESDIEGALRGGGNPGPKIKEIFRLDAKSARRVFNEDEMRTIGNFGEKIGEAFQSLPSSVSTRIFEFLAKPVSGMLSSTAGRELLRNSFTPTGKLTVQNLNAALQLWKAYQAMREY